MVPKGFNSPRMKVRSQHWRDCLGMDAQGTLCTCNPTTPWILLRTGAFLFACDNLEQCGLSSYGPVNE